jgi:cyanophycin synthetase
MSSVNLNASSRILFEEAKSRGISCAAFPDKETVLMEYESKQWYTRGSRTSFQSSIGKTIADYKPLTKQVLHHFGLPTSKSIVITAKRGLDEQARQELSSFQFPVVIKPLDERHGKGVVVGLKDIAAVEKYVQPDSALLVEEQLKGTEFRVVCVDFKFVAAAFRKPAHVVGNGQNTISELIAEKNKHPWRGEGHHNNLTIIKVDQLVEDNLKEQNLTVESVPEKDQEVLLRKTANLSTGGEAWDVSAQVHPANKALFEKIARACDLNVVGIDVMCQDLSSPIVDQESAGVIEVNASPGLRMHHFPIKGEPINVAGLIIDLCLREIT